MRGAKAAALAATPAVSTASHGLPICVDLDGTLCRSDTLLESFVATLRGDWRTLFLLPGWLARGRAHVKAELATRARLEAASLPYREDVLAYLQRQRHDGRSLVLATAADRRIADAVANHLGIFDAVIASDGENNLKGEAKAVAIVRQFGEGGYVYAGNDGHDLKVWRRAGAAIIVGGSPSLARQVARLTPVEADFSAGFGIAQALLRASRPHQWIKNTLVFLPLIAGHGLLDPSLLAATVFAFLAFSLTASGIYLLNDLSDLESDRAHPRKRRRPFASGDLPLGYGLAFGPSLLLLGISTSFLISAGCGALLLTYAATSSLYSSTLKKQPLVDVFTLAALYSLRVLAGAVAAHIAPSIWLLSFCGFFFLALAILKRTVELETFAPKIGIVNRRGYMAGDIAVLQMLGIGSSFSSCLVLALYVNSHIAQATYPQPALLWALVPLTLFWHSRMWLSAARSYVDDDPIVYATRDWVAWICFGLAAAFVALACQPWLRLPL